MKNLYIHNDVSLISSKFGKCSRSSCTGNRNTNFVQISSSKIVQLWDNMGKYGTGRQATDGNIIRRMRCACWINKA
jgi:hypothetical protein